MTKAKPNGLVRHKLPIFFFLFTLFLGPQLGHASEIVFDPPINNAIPSASGVSASRNGSKVTITWSPSSPAVDLHYLVRANLCNGQYVIETIISTQNSAVTVQDKIDCPGSSSAQLFVVNKTGYAAPVTVPWP